MKKRMVRSQVQFDREQLEAIRAIARSQGVSIAEAVRRAVEQYEERTASAATEEALRTRAQAVVGRYASGYRDTSTDHDRHLAEAFQTGGSRT